MMMAAQPSTEELLQRLEEQQQAYLQTLRLVHEALAQSANANITLAPPSPAIAPRQRRRSTLDVESDKPTDRKPRTYHSSVLTGESDESDDDDELYVQIPLPKYKYDHEHLRQHLETYRFKESAKTLLKTVVVNGKLSDPSLFPEYDEDEQWHNSHYSVFDVGTDGAPLSRREVVKEGTLSIDSAIWQAVQDLNADPATQRPAVGRITIVREPSPIILGALHMTMNQDFDMDEIYDYLVEEGNSAAYMLNRAFIPDTRQQRSFVFKFDYFTIIGEGVQPMPWQRTDSASKKLDRPIEHIPISRCTSVVALSLSGKPVRKLRNAARKAKTQDGYIYDPWAPWHVLNIQCYPDHKHSMDSHDSTKHYVNGPEAFLHTLLAEFKDAEKRFEAIYFKISKLVIPPADFMFNGDLRDRLLFEDDNFTYSRRYFWAYQTLGLMNDGIKSLIDSYEDTLTDEVWKGKHKSLWPMVEGDSSRNQYWKKRMAYLRREFEKEIKNLYKLYEENDDRRKEIRTLRDQLFSGTSVLESRKSVELSAVTILQGHNIKLLTLVSIFFLPLTFVTSVFGMTNMPTEHQFKLFGVVMATVCIPFFLLIGSLNTTAGMEFWRSKLHQLLAWCFRSKRLAQTESHNENKARSKSLMMQKRSFTATEAHRAIQTREAQIQPMRSSSTPVNGVMNSRNSTSNLKRPVFDATDTRPSETLIDPQKRELETVSPASSAEKPQSETKDRFSWWERIKRRRRSSIGLEHNV